MGKAAQRLRKGRNHCLLAMRWALFGAALCCPLSVTRLDAQSGDWRTLLDKELPLLGHRNWIVVVDSAYPLQSSSGVETVETGASQQEVLTVVFDRLASAKHISPYVFMDAELPFVPETGAPGVSSYRAGLPALLRSNAVHSLPHEQLIKLLADSSQSFHVLILKTTLTIPYTSVFLRLDCKYWDAAAEQQLRQAMHSGAASAHPKSTR